MAHELRARLHEICDGLHELRASTPKKRSQLRLQQKSIFKKMSTSATLTPSLTHLYSKGQVPPDDLIVAELNLKPGAKIMMMGSVEQGDNAIHLKNNLKNPHKSPI